ncbi:MAG TPA: S8 family serine peptidase, partial [Actinomycetaceae bacterium]|nr:S8 family serine peptidase [Actinomycetaceae bacterium]
MSVGAAAALVLTLAAPAATADTSDPEHLGSASDLGVDVPETTPELSSEFATSRTGAWFVELEEEPVTRGGDLRIMAQARRDITTEARSAGVDLDVRQTFTRLWNGISANIDDEDIDVIRDLDQVKAVYPVLPIDAPQTPVSDKDLVYALSMTGADIAQSELGYTGEGLKVGIIDTGVDYDHPDLGGSGVDGETSFPTDKVVAGRDFVGDDYNADPEDPAYQPVPMPDPDPDDCHGHGTHVAGIVAADGDVDAGGVRGVAPGAQLGAYRVFGCDGSTEADIMAAAMEQALVDGMDVVNMSIGSAFSTFPQYPTAVAADNLVDAGVVVVASIGNSGTEGTWSAGAPGVGEKVIGVASFDNVAVKAAVFEVDGEQVPYMPASGSPAPPTEGSVPLARLGAPGTAESTACAPIEADLSGQAVLIERGAHTSTPDCDATFYAKSLAAQNAGAEAVVLYNNVPGLFSATVAGAEEITIPVVAVDREAGLALDATVADDGATLTWTDE